MASKSTNFSIRLLGNLYKLSERRGYNKAVAKKAIFNVASLKDFENKVKRSPKPVVVDFHASWCSPCRALEPRLVNIVSEQKGQVQLARVDVDELGELAMDYDVASVPSVLVMCNGKVINRMVGLHPSDYIRDWLKKVVKLK
ncbi:hypothetical protein KR222_000102 [Zaprionus bogoriensis]|nr:hypothetical protein KR222_000102 [Zaprionus bogoriensis]